MWAQEGEDCGSLWAPLTRGQRAAAEPEAGLTRAVDLAATRGRWLLVTGSLHLVGALRARTEDPEA